MPKPPKSATRDAPRNTDSGLDASAIDLQPPSIAREDYHAQLHILRVELVKLQRHFISCRDKILVRLEARDPAGKDGDIKRITENVSPHQTRDVALRKPPDRNRGAWYFQFYAANLPVAEEFVLLKRSWYRRAGVEHIMGFCSQDQHQQFMLAVPKFEEMLVNSGIKLTKYCLHIRKSEQMRLLVERKSDPLKQWKSSPVDAVSVKNWKAYCETRDAMLLRTHTAIAPWHVHADDKRLARLNLIRGILSRLHYEGKTTKLVQPDPSIALAFTPDCIDSKRLAH